MSILLTQLIKHNVFIKLKQCYSLFRCQNYVNYNHLPKNPQTMIMNLLSIELQQLFEIPPNTGCSDPVRCDLLSTDAKTHFIKLNLINKGIDAVNLSSILRSKSVTETVPTNFKEKEPPIISYTYTKTIASKIFNFSSTLSGLGYHQFHKSQSQCECNTSSHLHQPFGHVVTGDLSIIPNSRLRDLIAKGPKYREPSKVDWHKNLSLLSC